MQMRAGIAALVIATTLVIRAGAGSQEPPTDFIVGVFASGSILPIAHFSGGRWSNEWGNSYGDYHEPLPGLKDVPVSWLGRAVPAEWSVRFTVGGTTHVHVVGMDRYGCEGPAVLTTEPRADAPRATLDTTHIGLAFDREVSMLSVLAVPPNEATSAMQRAIVADARHHGSRASGLRWLLRAGGPAASSYYFETPEGKIPGEEEPRIIRGWLRADGLTRVVGSASTYCGNEEKDSLPCEVPLGVLRFDDHEVWVIESPSGETGSFAVWRIDAHSARLILNADAGGC